MKYGFLILFLLSVCTSCKYFETEKITSEEFLEEELKSITWNEVDTYPHFPECAESLDKPAQKECFESTLRNHIQTQLLQKELISIEALHDTVFMTIDIDNSGEITLAETTGDSITFAELPELKYWLEESIAILPKTQPALKRGIPIHTRFTLPLVVKTD